MKRSTRKTKVQKQELPANDLAEDALEIVVKNSQLDEDMIKALRLVCKRTKAAATGRVTEFKLTHLEQDAALLRASGLLENITKLTIDLDLRASADEAQFSQWSRAVDLLHLVTDTCRKYVKEIFMKLQASPEIILASACLLGKSSWDSLEELIIMEDRPMPGFLTGFLARAGSFPALKDIYCVDATASDIDALANSGLLENLNFLTARWSTGANESNTAPAMMAAMRNLLQKATNLEALYLTSHTFELFDCEQLMLLKELTLDAPRPVDGMDFPSSSPALARPWPTLESLHIRASVLEEEDIVRILDDQDTLPVLQSLKFQACVFNSGALLCIRRPRLTDMHLICCANTNKIISKMAELIRGGTCILPHWRKFYLEGIEDGPPLVKALLDLFSCSIDMKTLDNISIVHTQLSDKNTDLLRCIADYCPRLLKLDISGNKFGRSVIALLHGYAEMGVWQNLLKVGILEQQLDDGDPNKMDGEHPYLPNLDVVETLQRAWPHLEIY